jgi:REP element-mobilizing transposase RayT
MSQKDEGDREPIGRFLHDSADEIRLPLFMRNLRHFPPGSLVEVTTRTVQGRPLMVPSPLLNQIIVGVLGRAQNRYPVRIHSYAFTSTHYHLIVTVDDARQLAQFMGYLNSKLGREIGRLTGWKDKIWSRRYQAILISNEEEAQVGRMKYVLSHGAKENLVASPQDWPGVHCVHPLLAGEWTVQGTWYDRRREYALRRSGKDFTLDDYTSRETLTITPLPCWKNLSPERYRERIDSLVREILFESERVRTQTGIQPLGAEAVCRQNPETRPRKLKKSAAPLFHAYRKKVRQQLYETYALFVAAFREAAERLRAGSKAYLFPVGSFPPGLPFVAEAPVAV